MTEESIISHLISRDDDITEQFFFKDCRPLFISIIRNIFPYEVDYDEFVNEFYLYLMENDAHRLRQFEGRSSIFQWMKIVAIRYFIAKRNRIIDNETNEEFMGEASRLEGSDKVKASIARMDIHTLFDMMPNKRQVYVIKRMVLEDAEPAKVAQELNVTVDNLYNIKKRAIAALTEIALKEAV